MFEMILAIYESLNNYVFGSAIFTTFAFMFLIFGYMVMKGFSFDAIAIMSVVFFTVGSIWLFPAWSTSLIYIIAGLIIGYMLSKIVAR